MQKKASRNLMAASILLLAGCPRQAGPEPAGLDVDAAAAGILQQFDTDGNKTLSKSELKASPSLLMLASNSLSRLDGDGDSSVTEQELRAKIRAFVDVNRVTAHCYVTYRGRPLSGAAVKYIPEPYMGSSITNATGTTDPSGLAEMSDGGEFGGMVSGLYRVEITHPEVNIASDYNVDTTLGVAVDGTNPYAEPVLFKVR